MIYSKYASGGSISVSPEMEERATKELHPLETAARLTIRRNTECPDGNAVHGHLLPPVVALTTDALTSTIQRTDCVQTS